MTQTSALQTRAMLANLTIRQWTARKQDKKISREVEAQHGAKDAGNFNKLLISKGSLLPYSQHAGRVRDYHYNMTLPWGDNGDRLLPSTVYFDYTQAMRKFSDDADRLADAFEKQYPNEIADARASLGSMYNPEDYPPVADIRRRFGINISFLPVPEAEDFRVDVGDEAVAEIKAKINQDVAARQVEAVRECWSRLYDAIDKIVVMMAKEKPIFRDSLITNVSELVDMLPKLNITDDPDLKAICGVVTKMLVPPARLRLSSQLRKELGNKANALLCEIANFK